MKVYELYSRTDFARNSQIVMFVVVVLIVLCFREIRLAIRQIRKRSWRSAPHIVALLVLLVLTVRLFPYTNPFYRSVNIELYETIEFDEEQHVHDGYFWPEWWGVYKWNFYNPGAEVDSRWNLDALSPQREYDYQNNSYIVSLGREMETLSYNIWESDSQPLFDLGLSTKWGKAQFSENIEPKKAFIYRIDKMYIDHDDDGKIEKIPYPSRNGS